MLASETISSKLSDIKLSLRVFLLLTDIEEISVLLLVSFQSVIQSSAEPEADDTETRLWSAGGIPYSDSRAQMKGRRLGWGTNESLFFTTFNR